MGETEPAHGGAGAFLDDAFEQVAGHEARGGGGHALGSQPVAVQHLAAFGDDGADERGPHDRALVGEYRVRADQVDQRDLHRAERDRW